MLDIDAGKIDALRTLLNGSSKIRIAVHTHPDGDAIGSGTALVEYLRNRLGKDAALIVPDAPPFTLNFLLEGKDYTDAAAEKERMEKQVREADLILILDLNGFARTEIMADALAAAPAKKVLIDHHLKPQLELFDLAFSCTEVSSTCELLYFILKELEGGDIRNIPAESLYALMAGMTTDTNNFANSVHPTTLQMAGELLEAGVDRDDILQKLYHSDRVERLNAFADLIANHMTILPCGLAYIILTKEMWSAYGIEDGETEGLVNIPLNAEKVKVSIFLREENGLFRVSIRAKKGWSANQLAADCFHGGGHLLAAGGKLLWPSDIENRDKAAEYIERVAARLM